MSLSLQAVDRLFTRLSATYGRDFMGRYEGLEIAAIKTSWAHELTGYKNDLESIAWALENLPERCPNVIEFRALCRRKPVPETPRIEVSIAGKERIAAEMEKLSPKLKPSGNPVDHKAWAKKILADVDAGIKRNPTSVRFAREALAA